MALAALGFFTDDLPDDNSDPNAEDLIDEGMTTDEADASGDFVDDLDPTANPDPWGAQSEPPPEVVDAIMTQSGEIADNFTTDWDPFADDAGAGAAAKDDKAEVYGNESEFDSGEG